MPRAPVIPELVYPDVREAVSWLCDTFGFTTRWVVGDHRAQLAIGDAAIVVMTTDVGNRETPHEQGATHGVMVRVEGVDAHFARARERGARVLGEPKDHAYGERQYNVEDFAGHHWCFGQTIADVAPEDWGGRSSAGP